MAETLCWSSIRTDVVHGEAEPAFIIYRQNEAKEIICGLGFVKRDANDHYIFAPFYDVEIYIDQMKEITTFMEQLA